MSARDDEHDEDWALEPHEAQLLDRARRAFGPTQVERERVLAQLLPALGSAPPVPPASETAGVEASASGQGLRYFWGVLAVGVAGMAGYGWGYQAGARAQVASAVAGPATTVSVAPLPPELGKARAPIEPEPERTSPPEPLAVAAQRAPASASGSVAAASSAPAGLDEEVRELRRIERAIRDGNPRLALVIGEDLDRAIPRGQLLLERRAASAMAQCQLEAPGARERAQRFIDERSGSAYAARVREICKLPTEPQRTGVPAGTDSTEKGGTR